MATRTRKQTFEEVFTEAGLLPKWNAKAKAEGKAEGIVKGEVKERKKWQGVVASKDAEIARLRAELEKR